MAELRIMNRLRFLNQWITWKQPHATRCFIVFNFWWTGQVIGFNVLNFGLEWLRRAYFQPLPTCEPKVKIGDTLHIKRPKSYV